VFTGLIAEVGTVASVDRDEAGARLTIEAELASDLAAGDSVAVAGVCLTASRVSAGGFDADVMNQTLDVTALAALDRGSTVNLEPALRAGDRLGGHIVQGHVDAVGRVAGVEEDGFARRVSVALPDNLERYVIEHGSIALDGVSLTVAGIDDNVIEMSLIPETLERTTLGEATEGRPLNVEIDLMARYAERLLQGFGPRDGS